jgi:hypothetical protein
MNNNIDFFNARMAMLCLSDDDITFLRQWTYDITTRSDSDGRPQAEAKQSERSYKIFEPDDDGNIMIRYFNLQGQPYRWKKEDTKQSRDFIRKRLKDPEGDFKYWQEKGSPQFPFFNKGIIEKYQKMKAGDEAGKIETLIMVEGEFKSFKAFHCGIDVVGLPSIHGFYNGDVKGKLHEDIQELIVACKVTKIIFLVDADLLTVKWEEGKDLVLRPSSFYASIKSFRESLQLLLEDDNVALAHCYFMHLKTKFLNDAKGIDDLLCKYPDQTIEIVQDLYSFQFAKRYFDGFPIIDLNKDVVGRIYKYLGLSDEQEFYKTYQEFIGDREFKFKRRRYAWNKEAREVIFVRHEDADKFMRIGPDWVKVITKLNKYGEQEEEIVPWKISEIQRDYKKYPDFLDHVQKYDDFCNEPSWVGEYKRVHNQCLNLCSPLRWVATPGNVAYTIRFLKHIFQGNGTIELDDQGCFEKELPVTGDPFTVALDYLSILLKHPKQMLPVPILVSPENGTGKSTFLKWLQVIFGSNMCILGNEQFKMKFNGHYITKFIVAIDEGFLEVDKKSEKERLKQLVTADSAYLENKGMNVRKINYFGKLIICSNDADRVMKIDEGESRWFVVRVPMVPRIKLTGQQMIDRGFKTYQGKQIDVTTVYEVMDADPDLEMRLKDEVPAFLHFLMTRHIHHPRVNRLWFDPEWFITDQFKVIVESTKNRVDRVFEDWLREQFMTYRLPVLRYPLKFLTEVFNDPKNSKYRIDAIELKTFLAERLKLSPEPTQRISIPIGYNLSEDPAIDPKINYQPALARPYVFRAENWISDEQRKEWEKPVGEDARIHEERMSKAAEINAASVARMQPPKENGNGYPSEWNN